ncbi:MAG: ABC transporter permease [Bacillus sp. (in: Bacteria)]|nr:ABC transporter permease [Bacillus sp. (in: firmicutes)]MCM1426715.1 ABC transporter permease [Eubacterium sp.]
MILWKLELKRTIKLLPAMLLEAVLLLGILGAVTFGASKLLYKDSPIIQITVAVIEEEENPLTNLALHYIQSMESIAATCRFLIVPEDEGFTMLEDGSAAAALVLPGGMIDGIMSGNNVPVQVYFPENAGVESALLKELTDAGVQMLRVAQAQIYGIYDTAKNYDTLEQLSVLEGDIDSYNLAFALERLALFQTKEISATGNLSAVQYAAASGMIFFLLMLGMACYPVMQSYPAVLQGQLMRQGIGAGRQCAGKWLCGLCSMSVGFFCFFFLIKGLLQISGHADWLPKAGIRRGMLCLLIILCVTTFVYFIFQLADNGTAAILLLFFLSIVMIYCSGGFVPAAFLPKAVAKVGRFLPTTYLIEAAGSLYLAKTPWRTIGVLTLYTAVFGAAAYGMGKRRKD